MGRKLLEKQVSECWIAAILQCALAPDTTLNASMGTTYGNSTVSNAKSIADREQRHCGLTLKTSILLVQMGFCQNWSAAIMAGGMYVPALYYGAPGLTASQVKLLLSGGYFSDAWAGCGQTKGIGEVMDQVPCVVKMSATCNGLIYTVDIDTDTLLAGKTVAFVGL
ncbi:hypothetical protein REC12_00525 [Desulfosporosinus sp. PR]|uniref:hypothetical protein n=1 Tax=Candidatus Desulfosporosinus nitrosoreducens TaxID=3401928 RepID=UPI0027FC93A4|nr:hypothetical protein [Desulfosporosinus sp. PR]MDQ7092079.1 hypothetical protein [Desulfosporosinus sp. PR]